MMVKNDYYRHESGNDFKFDDADWESYKRKNRRKYAETYDPQFVEVL